MIWVGFVILCALFGWGASAVGIPAAWLVGPMLVSIAFGILFPKRVSLHRMGFTVAQSVVGVMIAGTFRTQDFPVLLHHWYAVLVVGGGTIAVSLFIGHIVAKMSRMDWASAILGALPGGASGMIAMSSSMNADPKLVAVMQYVRMITVVLSASFLTRMMVGMPAQNVTLGASGGHMTSQNVLLTLVVGGVGTWVGSRLRIPAGALLGSIIAGMLVSLTGVVHIAVPSALSSVAYAMLGMYVGLMFDRPALKQAGMLFPYMLASSVLLIAICAGLGWVLNLVTGDGLLTCFLATSPGGLDSITLMAMEGKANVAIVISLQTVRLFTIIFLGPVVVRYLVGRHGLREKPAT